MLADRCTVVPCGVSPLKSAGEYLTLAYAGGCPGRFEVGCQIPMRFLFNIPAAGATVSIEPKQPNQPIALIADRSTAGLVLSNIDGPDGKSIGMEGVGISGVVYDLGEFSNEALRSDVNPWPQNVGIINSVNGIDFEFGAGANVDFRGILYGYVMGMKGLEYARKCGMISDGEMPFRAAVAEWQRTGNPPPKLMQRLEAMAKLKRLGDLGALEG